MTRVPFPLPADAQVPGRWADAGNLRVGDVVLLKPERRATISRLSVRQARQEVYNFQVEEVHTYAVGMSQVLVHNKPALNSVLPDDVPLQPGRMHVVEGQLQFRREKYLDFVVPGRSVPELFSARLMSGSDTLVVTGTASLGRGTLVNRLRQVQELAGGPDSFRRITGMASDTLEALARAGRFNAQQASESLSQALGGTWRVQAVPRPGTRRTVFDINAERIGG